MKSAFYGLILFAIPCTVLTVPAEAGIFSKSLFGSRSSHQCGCDECQKTCATCCPTVTTGLIKKTCYKIDCKQICIPAIRFPWQKCCQPKCGKVITVQRLKKSSKEVGYKCVYDWHIFEQECQHGCDDGCCDGLHSGFEMSAPPAEDAVNIPAIPPAP